jgi:hypothetical protein
MPTKRNADSNDGAQPKLMWLLPVIPQQAFDRHNPNLHDYQRCRCYQCDPAIWCVECVKNYRAHKGEIDAINAELASLSEYGKRKLPLAEVRAHHGKILAVRWKRTKLVGTLLLASNGQPQWVGPYKKLDGWFQKGQLKTLCPDHNAARLARMPRNLPPSDRGVNPPGPLERLLEEAKACVGKMPKVEVE